MRIDEYKPDLAIKPSESDVYDGEEVELLDIADVAPEIWKPSPKAQRAAITLLTASQSLNLRHYRAPVTTALHWAFDENTGLDRNHENKLQDPPDQWERYQPAAVFLRVADFYTSQRILFHAAAIRTVDQIADEACGKFAPNNRRHRRSIVGAMRAFFITDAPKRFRALDVIRQERETWLSRLNDHIIRQVEVKFTGPKLVGSGLSPQAMEFKRFNAAAELAAHRPRNPHAHSGFTAVNLPNVNFQLARS